MDCFKPEQVGTKGRGKMLKRIQILEDCRVFREKEDHVKRVSKASEKF